MRTLQQEEKQKHQKSNRGRRRKQLTVVIVFTNRPHPGSGALHVFFGAAVLTRTDFFSVF